ncbi:unnamed protein product [Urochloa humidicola]
MPELLKPTALLISPSRRPSPSVRLPSPSRPLVEFSSPPTPRKQSKKTRGATRSIRQARPAAMGPSTCRGLPLLLLAASLLVLSVAALHPPPPPPLEPSAAEALLARMCDPRGAHPAPPSWCHGLHLRRRDGVEGHHRRNHPHHRRPVPVPLPPPGRDGGEEIDARYGVAKRLVPTGPNPLHN